MSALTPLPSATLEQPDLFRLLVEQVKDYAIFSLDERGIIISWNAGAEHIKGYTAREIIGHHFSRFYPPDAVRAGWPQTELERARADGRFEDEGWRVRKDGTLFWANVVITALRDAQGNPRGFAKITRDLTARRRSERLEADAQHMTQFVAMLAHELRNPLQPIVTAAYLGQQQADDAARARWAFAHIERQAAQLNRLVDDLLDVSRITNGQIRVVRRRMALRDAIDTAVETVRAACDARGHALTIDVAGEPVVRGDAQRLTQVFGNLLGNACKFTPRGGRIELAVAESDTHVRISVSDSGVGIAPDVLPRIFDLFVQSDATLVRSEGGLGLGLPIVRKIVEIHGGTVTAHSMGSGCGAEFVVELPLVPGKHAPGEPVRLLVLLVDDNIAAVETLRPLLELDGHDVAVAHDGHDAVRLARALLPDVIVLDIGLPGMDGYEVAQELRKDPELATALLVAATGYGTEEHQQRVREAGFAVHIVKPLRYEDLKLRVPMLAQPVVRKAPATTT